MTFKRTYERWGLKDGDQWRRIAQEAVAPSDDDDDDDRETRGLTEELNEINNPDIKFLTCQMMFPFE